MHGVSPEGHGLAGVHLPLQDGGELRGRVGGDEHLFSRSPHNNAPHVTARRCPRAAAFARAQSKPRCTRTFRSSAVAAPYLRSSHARPSSGKERIKRHTSCLLKNRASDFVLGSC